MFRVKLALGKDFPSAPPKGYFLTKIFHPNVASNGEICVNTLKKDWKADLGIRHVLLVSVLNSVHVWKNSSQFYGYLLNEEESSLIFSENIYDRCIYFLHVLVTVKAMNRYVNKIAVLHSFIVVEFSVTVIIIVNTQALRLNDLVGWHQCLELWVYQWGQEEGARVKIGHLSSCLSHGVTWSLQFTSCSLASLSPIMGRMLSASLLLLQSVVE